MYDLIDKKTQKYYILAHKYLLLIFSMLSVMLVILTIFIFILLYFFIFSFACCDEGEKYKSVWIISTLASTTPPVKALRKGLLIQFILSIYIIEKATSINVSAKYRLKFLESNVPVWNISFVIS